MSLTQKATITVVGGGLAGSECALQLAEMGYNVILFEQRRGAKSTPAHKTKHFAELVCSNSFGSQSSQSAPGQLKSEARQLGSFILQAAEYASVPAGQALGVDREIFAEWISQKILNHKHIEVKNETVMNLESLSRPCVLATGPLTDESLAKSMMNHFGDDFLYFFDAIAPIIETDSIDKNIAWKANRYNDGEGDYYNCPLSKEEYYHFIEEIQKAKKVEPKEFEKGTPYFEGCMPIEGMVERGPRTLSFGPMKPVGLPDPRTGREPYAVVQLRQDNKSGTAYNMVGFQTKMTYGEQTRIFRMIPGLESAEFLKLGSIHRNLYVNSPKKLNQDLSSKNDPYLFLAGQITGVEGYFESTCTGLLVAHFINQKLSDKTFNPPPRESALGSILYAITQEEKKNFQPTNINFSLFPPIEEKMQKDQKRALILKKAQDHLSQWRP